MKQLIKKLLALVGILMGSVFMLSAQSVLNPADPVVTYNSAAPPATPSGAQIVKWVRTRRVSWNTDDYKCYYYNGNCFRLKFPKTYNPTAVDGKKYPMIVFFHGLGEKGSIYDNEYSLFHGGEQFKNAVNNGTFDGYILVMQTQDGFWGPGPFSNVRDIIDYMVTNNKLDPFRVVDNGLSAGGAGTWDMLIAYPTYIAGALPMSASSVLYNTAATRDKIKYTPLWIFQGGLDPSPDPYTTKQVRDYMLAGGANFKYTEYPDLGHGTWDRAWSESDFYPFAKRTYASNPWTLFGRTEFCPGDPINVTIGLAPGFSQYEWYKNGQLIAGATSNSIQVTSIGTYSARVRRGTIWSDISPIPVVIKLKDPTVPPAITVPALTSKVIPALDGSDSVTLQEPTGYLTYAWKKVGNPSVLGTSNTFVVRTPGDYTVQVTEQFGCSSNPSTPFTVVDANGPNKPDAAIGLTVSTLSKTSLKLDWNDNPSPQFNETNFEIYQASQSGGPYKLIGITAADVHTFTINALPSGTKFYFKVRAINNTAAAPASNEASGLTDADILPPTAPGNLAVTGTTRSSVALSWSASSDDVGVTKYDIYVNGVKNYVTTATSYTVNNLQPLTTYNFVVKARDAANNTSAPSNQVTAQTISAGLATKYYTFTGTWNALPDFNTLNPLATGILPNVSISQRSQNDNFAFLWEGFLHITTAGSYIFRTNSDDGSKVWLGARNSTVSPYSFSGAALVNNDGLHGGQNADGTITLQAGIYPIAIAFYEQGGGESMSFQWRIPGSGSFVTVPNSAFVDQAVAGGSAPTAPSNVVATSVSYNRIDLTWNDNSSNETAFEIWRSTTATSGFVVIGTTPANNTSYKDSTLSASTTYYYQVRAIGQFGESALAGDATNDEAIWQFNNNYNDVSGNGRTLSASNSPTFDASNKKEGSHSVNFNGSNEYVTMPTSGSFLQTSYSQKTIAFWMKSNANTGNRNVVDIGGSDDGLALRLDNNLLYAGVASNNTRRNFTVPYNYANTVWNHIALVYSGNTLRLYLNGVLAGSDNALPFSSVGTTTNGSRIANVNSSNAFNTGTGLFSGNIDNFCIYNTALSVADIVKLMNTNTAALNAATTAALPAVPGVSTLTAAAASTSRINLSWTDVATETKYELYRSSNTNNNYLLLATLPANTIAYADTGLFSNSTYFYKIRAVNVGGPSAFSPEKSATTLNNIPVLTVIPDQYKHFSSTLQLNVSATDADPENLTIQVTNAPGFVSFTPGSNGQGVITIAPSSQGTFNGITVTVTDQHGGSQAINFNLVVNANFDPVLSNVNNITLSEQQSSVINITATDQNASDVLTWSFTGLPAFVTSNASGGSVQLTLNPGYADNGTYRVGVKVDDGNHGFDTTSFIITINDVNPNKKIYINFNDGTLAAPAPWNNTNKATPSFNDNFGDLKDETGATTSIGLRITSSWADLGNATNTLGASTGNNSGVYPDNVMRSAYFTNDIPQTVQIYGLNPLNKYNFTFFGSRGNVTDDRTTVYTIGSTSVSLNAANNTQNTVSINNVQPQPDGTLVLTLQKGSSSLFAYLNAMVIENIYDDGTAPAKARDLQAQFVNNKVRLTWTDAAYNENSYEVYRSENPAGPFTLLGPSGNSANLQQYDDGTILGNRTYYYYVRATNSVGSSPNSDIASIVTPNGAPVLTTLATVKMKSDQVVDVVVTASDDPDNTITLTATNLPPFASFVDNGNGTGTVHIAPGSSIGTFNGVTITATDNLGASSSTQFNILVADKNITSYYVNFNHILPAGNPWNNFNSTPDAGVVLSALNDDLGNTSGINVTLVDNWDNANDVGVNTGNNSGIFPDDVMRTTYFTSGSAAKRIRISGLTVAPNVKYNLVLFASRGGVNDTRNTIYSYNGQSVTLNASNNSSNTAQLLSLVPNASGVIEFTAQRDASSSFAYINAMVIQSYIDDGSPLAPVNLVAVAKSKSTIQLSWTDKSNNETGFEVYRSTSANGTYTKLTTTSANVTTFTDVNLPPDQIFYYKVRAAKDPLFSAYSNLASASTLLSSVYVNLNDGYLPAAAPWNNTNMPPSQNDVFSNLKDSSGNGSGINLTVMDNNFSGVNNFGMITGNNSGVVPDNVMASTWWLDVGGVATLKIDGLNLAMTYNFIFFASRDLAGDPQDRRTVYTIGNQTATLNAANNTSQTVQISNVRPDENGAVFITIKAGGISAYGYIGAIIIQGYKLDNTLDGSTPQQISSPLRINNDITKTQKQITGVTPVKGNNTFTAYPNPFRDELNLKLSLENKTEKLTVVMLDISGRVVGRKDLVNLPQGVSLQKINMNRNLLAPGVYFLQVLGLPNSKQSVKVVKVN